MGHSMGANGTWHLGFVHADVWAALAPIAAGSTTPEQVDWEKLKRVPVIVCHGDADVTALITFARAMVARMKALGVEHEFVEAAGADHGSIVPISLPKIFDFFDRHAAARH